MIARRLLATGVILAVLAPAGCSDDEPGRGEARLEVDGLALVERADGDTETVDSSTDLRAGDRVELTKGTGRLVMRRGVRMDMREGRGDAANSMVRMGATPVLEAGDLLVTAPESAEVSAAGTTMVIDAGAARLSRALGVGVAAYDGGVRIDSAGVVREVPALREMQVPALGRPPRLARPLDYRASDGWDRRFLGAAIDLGRTLEALANGYTQNLNPGEGRTPGFFRLVLPSLDDEPTFQADLIELARSPGETLVGAAITSLGRRGGFVARWGSVFDFRDQGAEWGLVALDQGVSGTPLLGTIEDAVGASPLSFAAPAATGGNAAQPQPPGGTAPPAPAPSPGSPPTTSPPPPPPTPTPIPDNPITPVLEPVLEPVTDVVEPVIEDVSGLVSGLLG